MKPRSSRVLIPVAVLGLALGLSSCGDDDEAAAPGASASSTPSAAESTVGTSPTPSAEPEPEPEGTVIKITFADGTVTPSGERVEVEVGEPITLAITADAPGELHAHTTEELTLEYPAGESEQTIVLDQPGVVEVESHDLEQVIVQLQAS